MGGAAGRPAGARCQRCPAGPGPRLCACCRGWCPWGNGRSSRVKKEACVGRCKEHIGCRGLWPAIQIQRSLSCVFLMSTSRSKGQRWLVARTCDLCVFQLPPFDGVWVLAVSDTVPRRQAMVMEKGDAWMLFHSRHDATILMQAHTAAHLCVLRCACTCTTLHKNWIALCV